MPDFKPQRHSFSFKLTAVAALVALADQLFYDQRWGSTVGAFALVLTLTCVVLQPAVRRDARSRWALGMALAMAANLINAPTPLGWALFWTALAVAVLSPRAALAGDAWVWFKRIAILAVIGPFSLWRDLARLHPRQGWSKSPLAAVVRIAPLPLLGGGLFLALFALANPVIGQALASLRWPAPDVPRLLFWCAFAMGVWTFLRPKNLRLNKAPAKPFKQPPGMGVASVGASLAVFNALFALQNGLDIAFLWSGAALPPGVTVTDYVHRGAFTLIATALLAGLFVLVVMRPGSATAQRPLLRRLVVLWVGQNLILVASSVLRTVDYIRAYSLTSLRIAALVWMGLVATGLVLICWRMLRGNSASWLINANVLAAALVLTACSGLDLNAMAADWNAQHAREAGGDGGELDLCYLDFMGGSALPALSALVVRPLAPEIHDRIAWARSDVLQSVEAHQSHWRGWVWRDQRRLAQAQAIVAGHSSALVFKAGDRTCYGILQPPPPAAPSPAQLTPARPG